MTTADELPAITGELMGYEKTTIDAVEPKRVMHAIEAVNKDPRIKNAYGPKTLWRL